MIEAKRELIVVVLGFWSTGLAALLTLGPVLACCSALFSLELRAWVIPVVSLLPRVLLLRERRWSLESLSKGALFINGGRCICILLRVVLLDVVILFALVVFQIKGDFSFL